MISREFVLKNFNKKLLEAKRQRAKEVKFTLQEIDDLGYIIFEIMAELTNKHFNETPSSSLNLTDLTIDGGDVLVSGDVYVKGTLTLKNGSLLIGGYLFTPRRIIEYGCNIKEEYEFDEEPDIKTNSKSFIKKLLRK